ncbi:MAG: glycosyltransferase [Candidatus Hodarchaeales archaeon]|jgi:glycosyltransferase involved in cell wall biosynthesis
MMQTTNLKKVCVFVQVYNEYDQLEDLVQSLVEQTLKPTRVIIIDDGSPNPEVLEETKRLAENYPELNIEPLRLPLKEKPDLDTVGKGLKIAWLKIKDYDFDYVSILDVDAELDPKYYEIITQKMDKNPKIACASGALIVKTATKEYYEQINIGAKVGRRDARGTGKVIRTSLLRTIDPDLFPDVTWDTWINTKAKIRKFKTPQIDETYFYTNRPTTRVVKKDLYRNGRLTYYFGYNPIILVVKVVLAGKGGINILKGYWYARKEKWQLKDKEVRKYFGWKFFFHF